MRPFVLGVLVIAGCAAPVVEKPAVVAQAPAQAPAPARPAAPAKPAADVPAKPAPAAPATSAPTAPAAPAKPAPAAPAKAAPAAPAKPAAAPLDLKSLEQRLKETDAIGMLTKLSLKNQVDDLIERCRAFHGGQRPPTLTQLRPDFELLLMKVLSLLQDKDSRLARDIDTSREAIWSVLADPNKLATYAP